MRVIVPILITAIIASVPTPVVEEHSIEVKQQMESLPVYTDCTFKSYMDGMCITDTSSDAYKQLQKMYINENGIYEENGGYVAIAMNDFYGDVGDKFLITLSSGQQFKAVMTDIKADQDVGSDYAHASDGSLIEFVVDTASLYNEARVLGSLDCIYEGSIVKVEREV